MIKLQTIVDELGIQPDDGKTYLNRQTGEVVYISDHEMSAAEEEVEIEDFKDWEQENIRRAIEILETDRYVELPSKHDIHEWSIMRNFCNSVSNVRIQQELLTNVHGKGAFRHFEDSVNRHGIKQQWYRFRDDALRQIAKDWLEENEIAYEDDAPTTVKDVRTPTASHAQFLAIDHIQLAMPAHEEAKARAFYVDVLGLQEVPKPPILATRGGLWFESGNVKVHLGVEENFQPARKAHPAFTVIGWDALFDRCQRADYAVIPDDQLPNVRRAYVHDPFGNRIELIDGASD